MATIVTVHGTFAHADTNPDANAPTTQAQWWQRDSSFDHDMRFLLEAVPGLGSGKLDILPFVWTGENSETARRAAGKRLYGRLRQFESEGEPYCVVGHSHGGSVIAWALLESASRKQRLDLLKRWITVGTPFVSLKKERLLFQRLDLMRKVVLVASFMLLLMWLVYALAEVLSGERMLFGSVFPAVILVVGLMMSLPIAFFYFALRYWDSKTLLHYRRSIRKRAADSFAGRWQSLTHTDDEAVQGLAFLPGAKLYFFDKAFAVPAITLISVLAVPLMYLVVLTSPSVMVSIGDLLKTHVYDAATHPDAERVLREARERLTTARKAVGDNDAAKRDLWRQYREQRRELQKKYPDLPAAERTLRFKQRFFERNGRPCDGGKLCGRGNDIRINSGLLLHIVTDELSSAIAGEGIDNRQNWWLRLLIPAVVVPIVFGMLSLLLMLVIRWLAHFVSSGASHVLNRITNAEVKRAAFGNDTEGEIALGAVDRPTWIDRSPQRLPTELGDLITAYSNGVANQSLAKFRRAIGQLAAAEPKHSTDSAISTYFTWKELVHASYFDVPQFRKLIAQCISRADGFAPSASFQADPDFVGSARWLGEIAESTEATSARPASDVSSGATAKAPQTASSAG